MPKFYVTTPIYYVNDLPHIGHAYTTILADVLARYHRTLGDEVHFLTGTDEHGLKVQQAAQARGADPQAHCDEYVVRFQELWRRLHISNDDFIRTTEKRHTAVVQRLLQALYDKGELYQDEYEGWYSVSEERFITKRELDSGEFRQVEKVKKFVQRLCRYTKVSVDYRDERLTTVMAQRLRRVSGGKKGRRKVSDDAQAAALILQSYLDEKPTGDIT